MGGGSVQGPDDKVWRSLDLVGSQSGERWFAAGVSELAAGLVRKDRDGVDGGPVVGNEAEGVFLTVDQAVLVRIRRG